MNKLNALIKLIRPQQWVKNILIFVPLFFSRIIEDTSLLLNVGLVFIAFCFVASAVYCFNDIIDVEIDKLHPEKSKRPLASGIITKKEAFVTIGLLLIISAVLLFLINAPTGVVYLFIFYFALNLIYSMYLKQYAIIDVIIISIGFVIRLFIGGIAGNVVLSHWIVIMTFLLALFLAFAKRKDDCIIYENTGQKIRKNVVRYSNEFINTILSILSSIILVSYIMYTVSTEVIERIGSDYFYTTSIFVLIGILRYLQLTFIDKKSGNPTKILIKDRPLQLTIIGWAVLFAYFLYF